MLSQLIDHILFLQWEFIVFNVW